MSGRQRLAVFDLDGTLYDTNGVNYAAYARAMQEHGYSLDFDYYCRECNGRSYKEFFSALGIRAEDYEAIHNRKKDLYADSLRLARENSRLFDMIEILRRDFYMAIVTTASRQNCHELLHGFGRLELFDLILTCEDVSRRKPDPEGFLKAMEYFSLGKDATLIFEDSPAGIAAAKAAGTAVFAAVQF